MTATNTIEDDDARTFQVLLSEHDRVEAALTTLAKRAARKGLTPATWTWGKAYTQAELAPAKDELEALDEAMLPGAMLSDRRVRVSRIPLTIDGDAPHYAGWTFAAALEHLDGENVVRTVPGRTVPEIYRTRGPVCDHCQAKRHRSATYVLAHDDGRFTQVSSTCIADFLGSADASRIAAAATYLADVCAIAEGGCLGGSSTGSTCTLQEYLPVVAWCVRVQGWVSRTAARERDTLIATADRALRYLSNPKAAREDNVALAEEDLALAGAAETWAETLGDHEINRETGDYLHNLRAIARSGLVSWKLTGLAASMIVAHQRALGRVRKAAERAARPVANVYLGTEGKRETWAVTLDFVTGFETAYGYTTVLKFRTAEGATLVWKATNTSLERSDVGKAYTLTGTVKKHETYKEEKQTLLSRCKVVEAAATPATESNPETKVAS